MGVLTVDAAAGAARPSVRFLPGAREILAAHGPSLPQPDQLCGPFSAALALRALVEDPPAVVEVARAAGTRVWPHDVPSWRPGGAALDTLSWDVVAHADSAEAAGTVAVGLAEAVTALRPDLVAVPASGGDVSDWSQLGALIGALAGYEIPVAVLANTLASWSEPGSDPVGHWVIVWALAPADPQDSAYPERVGVADTYAELGAEGLPPGCRFEPTTTFARGLVDRGLLILTSAEHEDRVAGLVLAAGLTTDLWTT